MLPALLSLVLIPLLGVSGEKKLQTQFQKSCSMVRLRKLFYMKFIFPFYLHILFHFYFIKISKFPFFIQSNISQVDSLV